jgi:hypothetical protein
LLGLSAGPAPVSARRVADGLDVMAVEVDDERAAVGVDVLAGLGREVSENLGDPAHLKLPTRSSRFGTEAP